MGELWLKFENVQGDAERVRVDGVKFTVGRHSANNLSIVDGRLSREHLSIERFGDVFVVSDCGSSNGTKLNGERLTGPVAIEAGDILDLGGFVMEADIEGLDASADAGGGANDPAPGAANADQAVARSDAAKAPASGSFPIILIIAPVLGVIVVGLMIGIFLLTRGTSAKDETVIDDFQYSRDASDEKPLKPTEKQPPPSAEKTAATVGTSTPAAVAGTPPVPSAETTDAGKVEVNGGAFLRRIAQNDTKAFLTGEQAQMVLSRVKQLSGNAAVAANIASAKQNAGQIKTAASAINLKPQMLAVAAITKLGSSRGDVAATARSMAPTLEKLRTQIGSELADDALLIIAAYGQGEAGDFMRLRNTLQELTTKFPESSRGIRTIWFLQKNGKITQAEFDNAITFLAIGVITQNPKDFGVNAEALAL